MKELFVQQHGALKMTPMKSRFTIAIAIICTLALNNTWAQIGGRYAYEFMALPNASRITALGGSLINVLDDDLSLAYSNPALLNQKMVGRATTSYNFSFDGIGHGYLGYAFNLNALKSTAHVSVNFISFGDFTETDELGNTIGTFSGSESSVNIGIGRSFSDRIHLGMNIKGIFGSLEQYSSFGLGLDLGLLYTRPNSNLTIAMVVKNLGTELSSYGIERHALPLDIQLGISQRLEHLPFRFSIIAHQLQRWGIRYDDPDRQESNLFEENPTEPSAFSEGLDNFFRHFIFNGEFLLGKKENLRLRVGYNHLRRKELSLSNFRSLSGFSFGFGLNIKGVRIDYGVGSYHIAGATNHLTLTTSLDKFTKKL